MKTIKNGKGAPLHWWVGKELKCPNCGRVVELEVGDENHPATISATPSFFEIECAQCGKNATLSDAVNLNAGRIA